MVVIIYLNVKALGLNNWFIVVFCLGLEAHRSVLVMPIPRREIHRLWTSRWVTIWIFFLLQAKKKMVNGLIQFLFRNFFVRNESSSLIWAWEARKSDSKLESVSNFCWPSLFFFLNLYPMFYESAWDERTKTEIQAAFNSTAAFMIKHPLL